MDRQRIRDLTRKRLGETTAAFWDDVELNNWIDDACDDIAEKTKCLKGSGFLTTVTDTATYTVSLTFPLCIAVSEVYYYQDGLTWEKLPATTREELNITDQGWKSAAGSTPQKYYYDREEDVMGFYPKPNSSNDGAYAEVYYAKKHTAMTNDNDEPDIPENLHLAIIDFVVYTGLDTRGWGDKAEVALQKYLARIRDYRIERHREKEDEEIVSKNYRNI